MEASLKRFDHVSFQLCAIPEKAKLGDSSRTSGCRGLGVGVGTWSSEQAEGSV